MTPAVKDAITFARCKAIEAEMLRRLEACCYTNETLLRRLSWLVQYRATIGRRLKIS